MNKDDCGYITWNAVWDKYQEHRQSWNFVSWFVDPSEFMFIWVLTGYTWMKAYELLKYDAFFFNIECWPIKHKHIVPLIK